MLVMIVLNSMLADPAPKTILRCDEVLRRTGLSRTMLYDKIEKNEFPRQVPLGARAVGWYEEEIDSWIAKRAALRTRQNPVYQGQQGAEEASAVSQKSASGRILLQKELKTLPSRYRATAKATEVENTPILTRLELVSSKVYFDSATGTFWLEAHEAKNAEKR
jgi:prophage regulatory protein